MPLFVPFAVQGLEEERRSAMRSVHVRIDALGLLLCRVKRCLRAMGLGIVPLYELHFFSKHV